MPWCDGCPAGLCSDLVSWPCCYHLTLEPSEPLLLEPTLRSSVGLDRGLTVRSVRCHHITTCWLGSHLRHTDSREKAVLAGQQRLLVLVGWDPAYWDSNIDIPLSHHATPHYLIVLALSLHNLHLHHPHHHHHHPHWGHHCYISGVFCTAVL